MCGNAEALKVEAEDACDARVVADQEGAALLGQRLDGPKVEHTRRSRVGPEQLWGPVGTNANLECRWGASDLIRDPRDCLECPNMVRHSEAHDLGTQFEARRCRHAINIKRHKSLHDPRPRHTPKLPWPIIILITLPKGEGLDDKVDSHGLIRSQLLLDNAKRDAEHRPPRTREWASLRRRPREARAREEGCATEEDAASYWHLEEDCPKIHLKIAHTHARVHHLCAVRDEERLATLDLKCE
mmetsp:Transcript_18627/g.45799  ORF Transcript_18627/g.45799 Transcript_18627/m.45799 type:complete len:242 (-) Transcript_18627:570-1295(-)